jgi:hypothetical protein
MHSLAVIPCLDQRNFKGTKKEAKYLVQSANHPSAAVVKKNP